ncbi:GMC family oxidoreductase [Burkholderia cepacia]|uniref:GMC family oxidoreductase n=1 Tax=Burkholderia cepacia TaxID=292 RepID=UPI00299011E3|nr:GMC family oxidoreductase N-terminal domain-containing protein [Burkholderia cepacia]MDW9247176.1 FAD dependent oxidoreductase family protein [Burkholderia cepacia]
MSSGAASGNEFDYVVVGAGTAGCVLTNRLSANGASVCLLEAAPRDRNPLIHIAAAYIKNIHSDVLTWGSVSLPSAGTNNRRFSLSQGRALGGSCSINGLNYVRGPAVDYGNWAAQGNLGWSYREVLPYLKRSERRIGAGDDRFRSRDGELPITDLDWHHPISKAHAPGAESVGIPRNPDYNGARQDWGGYFQRTTYNGYRHSSARAFLRAAGKRGNVSIRTGSQAVRILFEGKRAVGVPYVRGGPNGRVEEVRAPREVIVSSGALNSPKLLQISGVGPTDLLNDTGIPVVHGLEGVGRNLRDHYAARMVARIKKHSHHQQYGSGAALAAQDRALDGQAPPSARQRAFAKALLAFSPSTRGLTLGVWQERSESLGYVHATSKNAFDKPVIQPNYLDHETDKRALIGGIRLARQLFHTKPLEPYLDRETSPSPDLRSDVELLDFARQMSTTVYHMISTYRMGPASDPSTVVDSQLRVHGVQRLRVADASIMPSMPSANTNASTLMIAEKTADMILGRVPQGEDNVSTIHV